MSINQISSDQEAQSHPLRLVYLTSKYPLLSETFIYEELLALREQGYELGFFAFYHTGGSSHQYAQILDEMITYLPPIVSGEHISAHWHMLRTRPKSYFSALGKIVKDNWQKPIILGKSLYAFAKGVAMARILKDRPPHHIHAHWATMPTTSALVVGHLLGVPFSFTSHAWDIFKQPAMLTTKLREAAFNITISEYNQRHLQQLVPVAADQVHVVRCGINLDRFPYREEYPQLEPFLIFTVGRLVDKKGFTDLVEACALLQQRGISFNCKIVGGGPQAQLLKDLAAEKNLQDHVELTGAMPQEQLRDLWQQASMFVLPCVITEDGNRDGIPVVLMEAMASGIPVITTAISGIPELVEDDVTGLLVPPHDPEQLCEAMIRLLSDPQLAKRLIKAGRERVEQEYNITQNASDKADLFASALSKLEVT